MILIPQESEIEAQHATSAAITISMETRDREAGPVISSDAASVAPREQSVTSPPVPDLVTRSVTGPGETSLLGVIR